METYPLDKLAKVAELLEVDISDLLDDYNAFLYRGQAGQVKALRIQMKLTQKAFAELFGVQITTVKRWEQGKIRMTKKHGRGYSANHVNDAELVPVYTGKG